MQDMHGMDFWTVSEKEVETKYELKKSIAFDINTIFQFLGNFLNVDYNLRIRSFSLQKIQ